MNDNTEINEVGEVESDLTCEIQSDHLIVLRMSR